MLTDYYFWFTQPSAILSSADMRFGYIFVGLIALAIILRVLVRFSRHETKKKLLRKLWHLTLTIGLIGLAWFGFRYENVPFLSKRFLAGLILFSGVVWLLFILKYFVFNYWPEKLEIDRQIIKNRYLPGQNR